MIKKSEIIIQNFIMKVHKTIKYDLSQLSNRTADTINADSDIDMLAQIMILILIIVLVSITTTPIYHLF